MPRNGNTIRLSGKSHSIPRQLSNLLLDLKQQEGVESVGIGKWIKSGNQDISKK